VPPRTFPHPIPVDHFAALQDQYLQDLVSFQTVRALALKQGQVALVGDFATIALGLSYLAWWRGRPAADVAAFASDAVAIALAATERGYVFRSPYDYWLLCCAAVALDHPEAERLLTLRKARWSNTPHGRVEGMLPLLVPALAAAIGAAGEPGSALRAVQALLREGLDQPDHREEALRFAPTVGALAAVHTGREDTWGAAVRARQDGWAVESRQFPNAPMFLLDWEGLAMRRLAREAGFALPQDEVQRPHALLEAGTGDPGTLGDRLGPS